MKKITKSSMTHKLDKLVSEIVRSKGCCAQCSETRTLQAAHIFSRNNRSVRWSLVNVLCLCAGCHFWAHQNPVLFTEWIQQYYGIAVYCELKRQARTIKKWSLDEMATLYVELSKELE